MNGMYQNCGPISRLCPSPKRVNLVILTMRRSLPVYPQTLPVYPPKQKNSEPVGTRICARTITALGKVVGRAVAIRMQIEDSCHNTKMSRRP
jgi:hypothetical protein